jgi:transposase
MSKDSKRPRRQFTTDQKVAILRRHLVDKVHVSDLRDEYKLQPSLFYQWQRQLFDNLAGALEKPAASGPSQRERKLDERIALLGTAPNLHQIVKEAAASGPTATELSC